MNVYKLRMLVRQYKQKYINAKTDEERQSALWHLDCYETDLIILDDNYTPEKKIK